MESITSKIDNNTYKVVSFYSDKETAADLIAQMNDFAKILIKKLKEVYINIPDEGSERAKIFKNTEEYKKGYEVATLLIRRFNPDVVMENYSTSPDITSYTTNKGESINMCLREKQSGEYKFHDLATLKFVFIHELAHIVTIEMDHVTNFWINFKFLLEFCDKYGIYKSKNYDIENEKYCGMDITYTPINDKMLPSYFSKSF